MTADKANEITIRTWKAVVPWAPLPIVEVRKSGTVFVAYPASDMWTEAASEEELEDEVRAMAYTVKRESK